MTTVIRIYPGTEPAAVLRLENDGTVSVNTRNDVLRERLTTQPIFDSKGGELTINDGRAFLEALPEHYTGAYMRAEIVRE